MKTKKSRVGASLVAGAILLSTPASLWAMDSAQAVGSAKDMAAKAATMVEQLNINTASVDALAKVPGIGPKIGEAIAAYRENHGAFKSLGDLLQVEGIDGGLLEKIQPLLTL
ncbi:ComEA family DNA-binding protein [Desulfogranum mediterraneum]|uniref:ComEA family DNA-binding protein n=1 Tax=Desulfogranum mediterraneum TaxID=160661 RepID=UPI0004262B85|nr:helix-hairpin-helix domain-containing protein [Desulfogranum mediterraneum]